MEVINNDFNYLFDDLWIAIIMFCCDLGKFIMHFVSKRFQKITMDNNQKDKSFVKYFTKTGIIKNSISNFAAQGSFYLNILKWAHEYGIPWNESICSNVVKNGHIDVLKYLVENNANFHAYNENAIRVSICNDKFDIFMYLVKKGANIQVVGSKYIGVGDEKIRIDKSANIGVDRNNKICKRSNYQIFMSYEVRRQRTLDPKKGNKDCMGLAAKEWGTYKNEWITFRKKHNILDDFLPGYDSSDCGVIKF